jgi:hypothetical protein
VFLFDVVLAVFVDVEFAQATANTATVVRITIAMIFIIVFLVRGELDWDLHVDAGTTKGFQRNSRRT